MARRYQIEATTKRNYVRERKESTQNEIQQNTTRFYSLHKERITIEEQNNLYKKRRNRSTIRLRIQNSRRTSQLKAPPNPNNYENLDMDDNNPTENNTNQNRYKGK